MSTYILAAFFVYFCILLFIGLMVHRAQTSSSDFIIGNRSLNFWVTALSAHASDMSAWLFMAFPAAIFIQGLSQIWIALGLVVGMFLNWQFISHKLRKATEASDSCTLSTFFERRFSDSSGVIRILTAIMSIVFLTCYLSAGLTAMGVVFEEIFGINYYVGLSVATLVAMVYTFSGGFVTVAWTDLFQAIFLLGMIILVPTIAFLKIPGGLTAITSVAKSRGISLQLMPDLSVTSVLTVIFLVLGWGIGYFGQPHIITKFMGIRNANELHKSKYVGMSWMIIALTAAGTVGLVGIGYFPSGLENPELVFVTMVKSLFNPFVAGLILCAIIAANMSTMDSQILVCASILSEDFYKRMGKNSSQKALLKASRVGVIVISLVSLFIAFNRSATILDTVLYAWSGLGSAFGPLMLVSLYSKKANRNGAIAGIITGGIIAGIWPAINESITALKVPPMVPGFFISLLSIYLVSMITGGCAREKKII